MIKIGTKNGGDFRQAVRQLKTLTMMQLKEKLDLSFVRSFRKTLFKIVWLIVEFAAITAICTLIFNYVKILGVFSLVGDIPETVMTVIFSLLFFLSVISSTIGLVKSLYFAKDNMVLLTFPVRPYLAFLSKLAVYYVYELKKNIMFTVPIFIAYGISKSYTLAYYPWLLFLFVFISILPVLIAALLSIPFMFVYQFIRKVKVVQYLIYLLLGAALVTFTVIIINRIPPNIDLVASWGTTYYKIQDFLNGFCRVFSAMYGFTVLIVGKTVGLTVNVFTKSTLPYLGILIAVTVATLTLNLICSQPLFYKMASKPFEYLKRSDIKTKRNKRRNGFVSAVRKEFTSGLRGNSLVTRAAVLVVLMPISIFLLNKIYSAMNTRYTGMQMTVSLNVLIMLLILLSSNISVASCYSRDGSAAYLNKIQPTGYEGLLISKLICPMLTALAGTIISVGVFSSFSALSPINNILLGLTVYLTYIAHLFWSAEMDVMKPQYEQYATFNEQANNPNENMSAVLVFVMSLMVFASSLFLSLDSAVGVWLKLFVASLLASSAKVTTFITKIKVFYKEK